MNQKTKDWLFIERVNLLCTLTGKSQSEIAKNIGISKGRLSHYLTGKRQINEIVKTGIAKYFNVPEKIFTQFEVHLYLKGNKLIIV